MGVKYLTIFTLIVALFIIGITCDCPPSSKVTSCSPKCLADSDCSPGAKCCPNICNANSCSQPNAFKSSQGGYKQGISTGTGTYCGNTKCNAYQRCEMDKSTKKLKCL